MATCKDCICYSGCSGILNDFGMRLNPAREVCDRFEDHARFVELPDDFPKYRLTTDEPKENYSDLLNCVYAKDGNILLRYANGKESMDLCDYIAFHAKDCLIDSQDVRDGACLECDDYCCSLGRAYIASVQAAKLRERLKLYEDLTEQALKLKTGDTNA